MDMESFGIEELKRLKKISDTLYMGYGMYETDLPFENLEKNIFQKIYIVGNVKIILTRV